MPRHYLTVLTGLTILIFTVIAGPVFGIPTASSDSSCNVETPIGTGQASVSVTDLPDSAVLERSRFGAKAWHLDVDPARVDVGPVSGRPTVTYKLRVEGRDLAMATASTAILNRCNDTSRLVIDEHEFSPRTLEQDSYTGTIKVTYRGSRGDEDVEERLATKNITVRVER
jgi:hypothetical protein